ncbi:hypothetical protein H257_00870 [Aphanomyces astaci]|uniref:PIPK domain-containing protein n=1 Tax=Aphanomyces astaci TaxID=112090 RepID=W4HEE7_APHAT|nr:hypothetical protein H257_00870 [Aphanomyces astaci]ETV89679.1 hypothetical protein H257_00870 [Aphanomyces astaci]|eukprot:XP_009822079.1 hypothetical protein H257_00870 [Aphanomyces astaci]
MVEVAAAVFDAALIVVALAVLAGSTLHFTRHHRTRTHPGPVLIFILFSSCMCILVRSIMHLAALNIGLSMDAWVTGPLDSDAPPPPLTLVDIAHAALFHASPLPGSVSIPFWAMLYFSSASTFWYLMLAMDLISSLSNPFLPFQANNFLHHAVAWPAAGAWVGAFYLLFRSKLEPTSSLRIWMVLPMYVVLAYIAIALFVTWKKSRVLETQAHTTTRRMAKLILPYLLVFGVGGVMDICLYAADVHVEASTGYRSWPVNTLHQVTQVLQLVAVFVLFQRKAGWVLCWRRRPAATPVQASASATLESPCAVPMDNTTRATEDDGRLSGDDLSVSNVLRQCIMKYTSMGIIESAQSAKSKPTTEVHWEDYTSVEHKSIVVHGEIDSSTLNFRDCAPAVFGHIRSMFGVTEADYIDSFALHQNMNEHGSEGKSGNLFYFTVNKRFMVKSVPEDEFEVLRSILPYYHGYLQSHPKSYLCRYFGCHSISLPVGTRRMYFVVMQNLFNEGPVDQRFDLKGNTDRRQAIQSHHVEQYIVRSQNREPISKLMMDIDFLKLRQAVHIDDADEAEMQSQLIEDITFLASRSIMDYSILLGVKFLPPQDPTATSATMSKGRDRLYYVGMIDMLQQYTWRWTLQRWFLGVVCCKDMTNVSAVPPNEYGNRLMHFVRRRFFYTPGKARCSGWTHIESPAHSELQRPSGPSAWTTEEDFLSPSAAAMWRNAQSPFNMQMVPPHRQSGGFFVASSY